MSVTLLITGANQVCAKMFLLLFIFIITTVFSSNAGWLVEGQTLPDQTSAFFVILCVHNLKIKD